MQNDVLGIALDIFERFEIGPGTKSRYGLRDIKSKSVLPVVESDDYNFITHTRRALVRYEIEEARKEGRLP